MASFSDSLKTAMITKENNVAVASAEPAVMTLEEPYYDGLAYNNEEFIPDTTGKYESTVSFEYGKRYEDENYSYVDDKKNVTVNEFQVNLTQETNSQYIPFEMFRYYDGIDLMNMTLSIFFVNADGDYGERRAINVSYSDTKIRFGFLVPLEATLVAGKLNFEIHATGASPLGGDYVLKTKPNKEIEIIKSLQGNGNIIIDENWATNVLEEVQQAAKDAQSASAQAQNYASQANNALAQIDEKINNSSDTITQTVMDNITASYDDSAEVDAKLESYAFKTEIPTVPTNVSDFTNDANYATETFVTQQIADADIEGKLTAYVKTDALNNKIGDLGDSSTIVDYVDQAVESVDISDKLGELGKNEDGTDKTVVQYVTDAIENVDVSDKVYTKEQTYNKDEIDDKLDNINLDGYTTEEYVNTQISPINTAITTINQTLDSIDKSPNAYYVTTYNEPYTLEGTQYTGENALVLYEIYNKDTENETRSVVSAHIITGGSGGSTSANTIKIERITDTPLVVTTDDPIVIEYTFIGTDASGDDIGQGNATWKLGSKVFKTESIYTGDNFVDLTEYLSTGSDQKVTLIITDDIGTVQQKTWYVSVVDVKLVSTFDDTKKYTANQAVNFTYTPSGAVDKTVHFLLDGKEIDTVVSTKAAAGLSTSYAVPAQAHGTHILEAYMTATINNKDIESNHIVKDIIWYDATSTLPLISCVQQKFKARQYEATNITYTVYDPSTETPTVTLKSTYVNEDGEIVEEYNATLVMTTSTEVWQFKTNVIGEHTLTITCGETVKTLVATITELGIEVNPITTGLVFDFNPVGYSNNDENRLWTNGSISMTVSDNFDWTNGGYQIDANGDQCFCIKAGTSAEIDYELFGDDAKTNGKQMKLIFKTENVADSETTFLECLSDTIGTDPVGIEMKAQTANIYAKTESLPLPYAEEEIIEFEFNITTSSETIPMVMGYEDGVSTRPMVYGTSHDFQQHKDHRKIISLGSPDCDLYIYRFKVYNTSLSDRDILNNFIADARSAEEMISRYERNQIYKEGILDPDYLAEKCPDLRIIKIECPRFTQDKDDKVAGTTIECIYKNGDPILDNWIATDCVHSGQGTSSNNYGASGRNLDLIMKTYKDYGNSPVITLSDGTVVDKVSLTRTSVPVNYFNLKVNIASSENANNACLANRYNTYNPYNRPFVRTAELSDAYTDEEIAAMSEEQQIAALAKLQEKVNSELSYIKDTMEFQNCVVFLRETGTEEHTEFADDSWHFYAIGNIGDSKKTDDTRLTDPSDPYECILEVMDNTLPLSTMPTGKVDENGAPIYPIDPSEWVEGNVAYDALQAELFDESKATDKENGLADTYGWRYIYEDGTDEENTEAKAFVENQWREFYKFVVTSTDEEFKDNLGNWVVLDSVMYYYLFTLRYTMTDNHAKNSFWHYGKSNDLDSEGNPIRKWDLCFGYDFDKVMSK